MKGIILAGGFGTRLRPLTFKLPKPMVPILGRPMMEHVVSVLREAEITDCVSLLFYEPESIKSYFGDGSNFGVNMNYVLSRGDWGTAGAVKNAAGYVDDTVVVISGDVLSDFDLNKAIEFHKNRKSSVTIVLTRVEKPLAFGIVIIDPKTGEIKKFLEKPAWGQVFSDTINTGIYVIEPHVLDYIPKKEEFDFSKDLFPLLMQKKEPLYGYVADGYWRDVGNLREYRRANEDALSGRIELNIPGEMKQFGEARVFMGENVEIEDGAEFEGTVLLGDNTSVRSGSYISDTVIGNNCKIGLSAEIHKAVLWNNIAIGDKAHLDDCTVASNVDIGDSVVISDHSVISENCQIGEGALVSPAVKIWPDKKVAPFSAVRESLVWQDRTSGELFAGSRVSGLINSELSPEFVSRLGAALGVSMKKPASVLLSRDSDRASQITERALFCGMMSAGVNVVDLGIAPIPVVRWILTRESKSAGVHVRKSPRDIEGQDVIFFNGNGTDLSTSQARGIERLFNREDFMRADYKSLGKLERPAGSLDDYRERMLDYVDSEKIAGHDFRIIVDYSYGGAAGVLPSVLSNLNVDVININAVVDPNRITRTRERREADQQRLANIVRGLNADAGFMIDPSGESLHLVDDHGMLLDDDAALCTILDLAIHTLSPKSVAVPISATLAANYIARDANIDLKFTRNNHLSMMEAALSGKVDFVGGTRGGFIFPKWLFAADAMFAIVKILEMMAETGMKLSEISAKIPEFMRGEDTFKCSFDKMGRLMRGVMECTSDKPRDVIDGIKIYSSDSWILIIPDKEYPTIHLIAEARTETLLNDTLAEYRDLLADLM